MAVCLAGCLRGDFERVEEIVPTPDPGDALDCPEIADCTLYECGVEPVCGKVCGTCEGGDVCAEPPDEEPGLLMTCCTPISCDELGATCGVHDDGCGGTVTCGDCAGGRTCDQLPEGGFECAGCGRVGDGDPFTFEIESAPFAVRLTLHGEAASAISTATDHGALVLRPSDVSRGWLWHEMYRGTWDHDLDAARDLIEITAIPGTYDLYYRRVGHDPTSAWPMNRLAPIATDVEIPAEGLALEIDLQPLTVPFELTLDDVPLADVPLAAEQGILLELRTAADEGGQEDGNENPVPDGLEIFRVGNYDPGLPSIVHDSVTLLPGSYGLYFSNTAGVTSPQPFGGTPWPLGDRASVANVPLSTPGASLDLALPALDVSIDLTLAGTPVDEGDLLAADVPGLQVRRVAGTDVGGGGEPDDGGGPGDGGPMGGETVSWITLPPIVDLETFDIGLPMTVRLFHEDYEIAYRNDRTDFAAPATAWPMNTGIVAEFTGEDGVEVGVDVGSVEVFVQTTLNGSVLTPVNTAAGDHGRVGLQSATAARAPLWLLPAFVDEGGAVEGGRTLSLLPDDYHVAYTSEDRQSMAHWPTEQGHTYIATYVDLTAPASFEADVRAVLLDLTGDFPATAAHDHVLRLAHMQAPLMEGLESHGWVPEPVADTTFDTFEALLVVPGMYRLIHLPTGDDEDWPFTSQELGDGFEIFEDVLWTVDLSFRRFPLNYALNGDPNTEEFSTAQDHGEVWLTRPDPRATWNRGTSLDSAGRANLPVGEYILHYYPAQAMFPDEAGVAPYSSVWPLTAAVYEGCLVVE